jgi:hypothetical protein
MIGCRPTRHIGHDLPIDRSPMKVAGRYSDRQWIRLKKHLQRKPSRRLWDSAFRRFFRTRIDTRYLKPMASIRAGGTELGEGFAIVAVFCTLVEFLESCERGHNFRFIGRTATPPQPNEYNERQAAGYFKDFLRTRRPFNALVPAALVDRFYSDVRCGLVHEARTKGGWVISTKASGGVLISQKGNEITLFRNELIPALEAYLADYRQRLLRDPLTQAAFVRKFDHLCVP